MADDCCSAGDGCCAPPAAAIARTASAEARRRDNLRRGRGLRLSRRRAPLRWARSALQARALDGDRHQRRDVSHRDDRRPTRFVASPQGRRAGFSRRHRHLRLESGGDRGVAANPRHGGPVQGPVAEPDGVLGVRIDDLPHDRPRFAERRTDGRNRRAGAGGQSGLGADADALQGRRRQRALGLAVFAQRRDRQRGGDDRGDGRLGNRNRLARSWRRGVDGRNFSRLLGADPAAGLGGISRIPAHASGCGASRSRRRARSRWVSAAASRRVEDKTFCRQRRPARAFCG